MIRLGVILLGGCALCVLCSVSLFFFPFSFSSLSCIVLVNTWMLIYFDWFAGLYTASITDSALLVAPVFVGQSVSV